jgi:integrase
MNDIQPPREEKKKGLSLKQIPEQEGLKVGIKSDGTKYTVRDYRNRYFFPDEWKRFYNKLNPKKAFLFDMLINTGARIEEALCIKVNHIRFDRNYLTLYITKIKARKGEVKSQPRDVTFSKEFARKIRKYISDNKLGDNDYLFLDNSKQYLSREEVKEEAKIKKVSASQMMKRALKKSDIKDWYMFSLHNIRKTHGMWLKALDVKFEEICKRLGHDANTYLKHYGSSDIFNRQDKLDMIKLLGELGR